MAEFHFVEDYERHVDQLIANHPLDEAMKLAVGGMFEQIGGIEVEVLRRAGLQEGMRLIDLGCGSGRLAAPLAASGLHINYVGTDIVQRLLDYAKSITPIHYSFICHRALTVPAESDSVDMISAFSLFTHLLHHETYLYLEDSYRVLKKGGRVVFSFLEFALPMHWHVFAATVSHARDNTAPHLNTFIERDAIRKWSAELGYKIVGFEPSDVAEGPSQLGQSVVVLEK